MYIEYVLIENLLINYFITTCSQKILKNKSKLSFLGIILATTITILCPIFNLNVYSSIAIKILTSLLLTLLCFKCKKIKSFLLSYSIFLGTTFMFGGSVEFLKQVLGEVTIMAILFATFLLFILSSIIIKILNRRKIIESFTTDVIIIFGEKKVKEKGYIDTGNILYDPITSKPICLISQKVFEKLYSQSDLISLFIKKIDTKKLKNGHYIDVNSAVKGGKMLIFDVDEMIIKSSTNEKVFKDFSFGLSFSGFEKGLHSGVLLHSSQAI